MTLIERLKRLVPGGRAHSASTVANLPADAAYDAAMVQELEAYADVANVHDLPQIFHYWSNKYVRPKFEHVGLSSPTDVFTKYCSQVCAVDGARPRQFVSIGAGNCDVEADLAEKLLKSGFRHFSVECIEINAAMLERARQRAGEMGVRDWMTFSQIDINAWDPQGQYDVVMANQSLHHFVNLEQIFGTVQRTLAPDGFFLADEMVGRNGHMRWPEALSLLNEIWKDCPPRYKYNQKLKRLEIDYVNWDCSTEGFEGIRAQDILPLLMQTFQFDLFVAFGNLIDVFVDRCFGHNFDPKNPDDLAFIDRVAALDEREIERGALKPTHMTAAMCCREVLAPKVWKHLTPSYCVRHP